MARRSSSSISSLKKYFTRRESGEPSTPNSPSSSPPSPFGASSTAFVSHSDLSKTSKRFLAYYGKCEGRLEEKFFLHEEVGKGAFGTVYRAVDKSNGATCCCKCIAKAGLTDQQLEDTRKEADILLTLNGHKNVVNVVAVFEDERHIHIVMEYCNGGDILSWLSRHSKPITEKMAADIVKTALVVVDYCHSKRVLYRDVKPDNFLVSGSGSKAVIKATDFGVSCILGPDEVCECMTGTKAYMAPEVFDEMYGFPADVWAVGVMMYLVLSGEFPFTGKNDIEMANAVYMCRYNIHSEEWRNVSDSAKDLLSKLLVQNANERSTAKDALKHKWLQKGGASDEPLAPVVQQRIRQYTLDNCPRRLALRESTMVLDLDAQPWIQKLLHMFVSDPSGDLTLPAAVEVLRAEEDTETTQKLQEFIEEQRRPYGDDLCSTIPWDSIDTSLQDILTNVVQNEISKAQVSMLKACIKADPDETGKVSTEGMMTALQEASLSFQQQRKIQRLLEAEEAQNGTGTHDYSKFIHGVFERMLPPIATSGGLGAAISMGGPYPLSKRRGSFSKLLDTADSCVVQ